MQKTIKVSNLKLFLIALLLICALLLSAFVMCGEQGRAYAGGNGGILRVSSKSQGNYTQNFPVSPYVGPSSYTLTFNVNSGAFAAGYTPPQNYTSGTAVSLPNASQISKKGHDFGGWFLYDGINYKDSRGSVSEDISQMDPLYAFTQVSSSDTGNKTFYAMWIAQFFILHIDYFAEGTEFPVAASYSNAYQFGSAYSVDNPTVAGYTVASAKTEGTMDEEGKALFVYYTPNADTPYTVIHKKENIDGTYSVANTDNLAGTTDAYTQAAARIYDGFTASVFLQQEIKGDGTTEVEILYTRNSYALVWDTNGGTLPAGDYTGGSVLYGRAITAPQDPVKAGYAFGGWNAEIDETMPAQNVTYTAQWSLITYDITYILGAGATNIASNPSTYSVESGLITLYSPARTGYTFAGFAEGNSIAAGSTGEKTFTAQWTLHAPQITGTAGFRGEYNGEEHTVSVIANHTLGAVTYQWYKNSISEENLLAGKTQATLTVKDVSDSGVYYCRVTYTDGTQTKHADSPAIAVSIVKSGLSGGVIVLIIIGALLLLLIAGYIALYIVWKKKDKAPLVFLKMSFRKLNKLLFKTELNDAELLVETRVK